MKEIRNIIDRYHHVDWQREKAALATVVSVEASSYRRVGARMFVSSSGHWVGGISGGCLEGDALRRAQEAIFREQPSVVTYDTLDGDDHQIGIGLGCNGKIEVLFTPVRPDDPHNPIKILNKLLDRRRETILLQIISSDRADMPADGRLYPLYPEKEASHAAIPDDLPLAAYCAAVIEKRRSLVFQHGGVTVALEWLRPEMRLFVVGDNYDVDAFLGIAGELGWESHLIGTPRKFTKTMSRRAKSLRHYDEVKEISLDGYSSVLLMSHDYQRDLAMLRHFLPLRPAYLGMLGPRKRTEKMHGELSEEGLDLLGYQHLFSPIGLDIGAESPEEIATSIAGEIIAVFRNREGRSLRERRGSIH